MTDPKILIRQFERAVDDKAFIGVIPIFSDDREEQQAINNERKRLKANYTRTYNKLLAALEKKDA